MPKVRKAHPITDEDKVRHNLRLPVKPHLILYQAQYHYDDDAKTVVCPECQDTIKLGKEGLVNFTTQHLNSRKCQERKKRRSQPGQTKKKSTLPSILGFLRPISNPVQSLASTSIPSTPTPICSSSRTPDYAPIEPTSPSVQEAEPATSHDQHSSQPVCPLAKRDPSNTRIESSGVRELLHFATAY